MKHVMKLLQHQVPLRFLWSVSKFTHAGVPETHADI